MSLNLDNEKKELLERMLSKVGDLNFRRRVVTMLEYLDIQPHEHILDIGCGEGFYSMIFDKLYDCTVVAVENDERMLRMAEEWMRESTKVTFMKGDICNLPFSDNSFDKIICTEVLEHIPDDNKAVSELYRVLKPGGLLGVTVPNKNYPLIWDPLNKVRGYLGFGHFDPKNEFLGGIWAFDHKRLYSPVEIRNLLINHGFGIENVKPLTHYGVPFNHVVLYIGKSFYTKFPVSEDIKSSMEKFAWDNKEIKSGNSITSKVIQTGLRFLKYIDSYNNRDFGENESTMCVAVLGRKK